MRITEVGSGDDQNNWFSGKISRVNLDKIWGQIDKFIVGGDELKMVTITMVMELAMEVVVFSINLALPCREMHQV